MSNIGYHVSMHDNFKKQQSSSPWSKYMLYRRLNLSCAEAGGWIHQSQLKRLSNTIIESPNKRITPKKKNDRGTIELAHIKIYAFSQGQANLVTKQMGRSIRVS